MKANDLAELVKQKIENLRPKLLDLSRRNPLIATKLGPRSNSHIRAVDELPDILYYKLNNGQDDAPGATARHRRRSPRRENALHSGKL